MFYYVSGNRKFHVCILHNHSNGTVSQNLYLSPSFHFMKSRMLSKHIEDFKFVSSISSEISLFTK